MKKSILLFTFLFVYAILKAADPVYTYIVDLTRVNNDQLLVTLITPEIEEKEITYYFPKIIPGTYRIADYGRFISDLKAYDKKGNELKVIRVDDNSWTISKSHKMTKLTYLVDDIFDTEIKENQVYPMAGTNIEDGKNFVLNTSGFFGYFEGKKELPFELKIIRPDAFYGSTGLIPVLNPSLSASIEKEMLQYVSEGTQIDHFTTENYNHFIDSPLMYCEPDTAIIDVAGTEVLISVYSPNKIVSSEYIASNLKEILYAQRDYLGGELPVDKYAFIFYCEDPSKLLPIQGALEHSYSSFYYFPDVAQENLLDGIRDAGAHEFFHIITPLNIHSEEIQYFDFNTPKISEHLWLYEGMTEYAAHHVQVKYGIISQEEYFATLKQKMTVASNNFNDTLSFTDLSRYTLDKHSSQYSNVYFKGSLIGMCLDIMLRDLSDGEYGTQDMMSNLSREYGKDNPFKDEDLFDKIVSLTYPEINDFFQNYVQGGAILPYEEVFQKVGVNYQSAISKREFSIGRIGLGVNENSQVYVSGIGRMNEFGKALGYEVNDVFLKINGEPMPESLADLQGFFDEARKNMKEGEIFTVSVKRGEEEVQLSSEIFKVDSSDQHVIAINEEATERQIRIRDAWLKPVK